MALAFNAFPTGRLVAEQRPQPARTPRIYHRDISSSQFARLRQRPGRRARPPAKAAAAAAAGDSLPPGPGTSTSSIAAASNSNVRLLIRAVIQVVVLAIALAALILLPAHLSGRLATQPARALASYCLYLLFFASSTITRMVRYGQLAPARQDAQRSSGGSKLALLLFAAVAVPGAHYPACLGSPVAAALLLLACLAYYGGRTALEEKLLEGEFGQQYQQYCSRTGRFLPRFGPA